MKTKRAKKIAWVLLGTAVVALGVWCNLPQRKLTGDELKLAKMWDDWKWYIRVRKLKSKLPESWSERLHLDQTEWRLSESAHSRRDELLASGYFTNVTVMVTNLPSYFVTDEQRMDECSRRLQRISAEVLCLEYWVHGNSAVTLCRPKDEVRLREALNQP